MPSKVWDEITYSFPNFKVATVSKLTWYRPKSSTAKTQHWGVMMSSMSCILLLSQVCVFNYRQMFLVSSYSYLCPIYWSQVLSRERRCSSRNGLFLGFVHGDGSAIVCRHSLETRHWNARKNNKPKGTRKVHLSLQYKSHLLIVDHSDEVGAAPRGAKNKPFLEFT